MSGEKTEKATAKKRQEARRKGQLLKSTEANTAFCSIVMFSTMLIILQWFLEKLRSIFGEFLNEDLINKLSEEVSAGTFQMVLQKVLMDLFITLAPIFGAALIAGIGINILQTGVLFTTETLKFSLDKINPISGFKRMFSIRSLVELLKSIVKIIVLVYVIYADYKELLFVLPAYIKEDLYTAFVFFLESAFRMGLKMSAVMVVIAAGDFIFQWWKYEKDLLMTKQEVKDEYKQLQGDPQIKSKIKAKQRQMSMMRMMSNVPDADVVITNPTHYAVALKYDEQRSSAPIVVAKGQDLVAQRIKEIAREHKVEIIENKPLAQALYAMCEVDDEIPPEFYQAVADILVFIYKQKNGIK